MKESNYDTRSTRLLITLYAILINSPFYFEFKYGYIAQKSF